MIRTRAFDDTLAVLTAAWTILSTGYFLPRALDGDPPSPDPDRQRPGRRVLLQHRLAGIAAAPSPVPAAISDLAAETLAATRRACGDHPLDLAPAWR